MFFTPRPCLCFGLLAALLGGTLPTAIAARRPSLYFPSNRACAIYQGNIDAKRAFSLWADANQKLTITLARDLTVAVIQQGKIVPAFNVIPSAADDMQEQSFRLPSSGTPEVVVRGLAQSTTIAFCLR